MKRVHIYLATKKGPLSMAVKSTVPPSHKSTILPNGSYIGLREGNKQMLLPNGTTLCYPKTTIFNGTHPVPDGSYVIYPGSNSLIYLANGTKIYQG